jgi:hypothetical protein
MAPPAPRGSSWALRCALAALALAACAGGARAQAFTCGAEDAAATCAALGALYVATSGAGWSNNDGWRDAATGTATQFCSFYGVRCDGGVVTSLCVHGQTLADPRRPAPPVLFLVWLSDDDYRSLVAALLVIAQGPSLQPTHGPDPGLARRALEPSVSVRARALIVFACESVDP